MAGYSLTDDRRDQIYISKYNSQWRARSDCFAGDDADPTAGSDLYTEFGLSSGGKYLGFHDPEGNLVSEFEAGGADFPAQFTDASYGFENDDTCSVRSFFATPTPGSANIDPVDGVIDAIPTVSVDRGFYDQSFTVAVTSPTPGATLVYTTDGAEPSLNNGLQVQAANSTAITQANVSISDTTSLRTAAFKNDFLTEGFTTHTYVFLNDVIASDLSSSPESNATLREALLDIPTLSFNYETVVTNSDVHEQ